MLLNTEIPVMQDFLVIFSLAIGVQLICHQFKLPAIIGFLFTGAIAGPHLTGMVSDTQQVEIMAEIGVIFLLFTLGMEFSFRSLVKIKNSVLIGGGIQVGLTIFITWLLVWFSGLPHATAIFFGFLLALSSTAIVIKMLQQKAQIDSLHGRTILGILIFQDIVIVPMMLLTPLLKGEGGNLAVSLGLMVLKFILIGGAVFVFSRYLVPRLMMSIARTRTQEIFLMTIITLCFTIAWLTSSVGLSLSLGAFLAGLILSESEYSHQALGSILPFRDIFTSIFFISVGMLLNLHYLLDHVILVSVVLVAIILIKLLTGMIASWSLNLPMKTVIVVGLCLFQVGEFSFVLAGIGVQENLLNQDTYQLFLSVSVLSMMLTPAGVSYSSLWADKVLKGKYTRFLCKLGPQELIPVETRTWLKDHLIIVGFGLNGRNLALAARASGIKYIIIETNPDTVVTEKKNREPIFFGDAAQEEVLHHAEIRRAKILVIAISDPAGSRRITQLVRSMNPEIHIIVRTRYVTEIGPLQELGANEVIPEEFETSVEIFTRVLEEYLIPRNDIEEFIDRVREDNYALFSKPARLKQTADRLKNNLGQVDVKTYRIRDNSVICGVSLIEANLRQTFNVNVVAISRNGETTTIPDPQLQMQAGDVLYILGSDADIHAFCRYADDQKG